MSVIIYPIESALSADITRLGNTQVPFYLNGDGNVLCNLGMAKMELARDLAEALGYTLEIIGDKPKVNISSDLGFIFHWGVYAVPAYDNIKSASRRKTQNGSEWYLKRLLDVDSSYRPTSGSKETVEYHEENYPGMVYKDFATDFTADRWDPDSWMKLCRNAGATYVILTTRHHDGFCLWPSSVAPGWNSKDIGPKKDLVAEFKAAADRHGLVFGVYYSWLEFGKNATKQYIDSVSRVQIKELIQYSPQIWFFDGDWEFKTKYALDFIQNACKDIHKAIPGALINDRLGKRDPEAKIESADYRVFSDRYIPAENPGTPWVHINTVGYSWGYNSQQKIDDYKTGKQLKGLMKQVSDLGGGFLLNLGPTADGQLDAHEIERIKELNAI